MKRSQVTDPAADDAAKKECGHKGYGGKDEGKKQRPGGQDSGQGKQGIEMEKNFQPTDVILSGKTGAHKEEEKKNKK